MSRLIWSVKYKLKEEVGSFSSSHYAVYANLELKFDKSVKMKSKMIDYEM